MEYVYALSNEYMPGIIKVGMTTVHPDTRAADISRATGVPGEFIVREYWKTDNCARDERIAHRALDTHRIGSKELFKVELDTGIAIITTALERAADMEIERAAAAAKRKAVKEAQAKVAKTPSKPKRKIRCEIEAANRERYAKSSNETMTLPYIALTTLITGSLAFILIGGFFV